MTAPIKQYIVVNPFNTGTMFVPSKVLIDTVGNMTLPSGAVLQIGSIYTAGAPAATGYINITDASGVVRKVLCA